MKKYQTPAILSLLASICFFVAYMTGTKESILELILSIVWFCIALENGLKAFNKKD